MKNIPPALIAEVLELRSRLDSILDQLEQMNQPPPPEVLLTNTEVRSLLKVGEKTLIDRMKQQIYIQGIHYVGDHINRRWKKSRIEFWIENQHNRKTLDRKLVQWEREKRSA